MPTYEYKREDGSTFEIIQKMSDSPLSTCPTTEQKVTRIISGGGGVVYKGEGWYVTDYKNGGRKKDPSNSSEKETTPSSDISKKPEAKPTSES